MILRHAKLYSRWTMGVDPAKSLLSLYKTMDNLRNEIGEKGPAESMSKEAVSLILPCIELNLMFSLEAAAVKQGKMRDEIWSLLASSNWERLSKSSDPFSSKLKQATHMHTQGFNNASLKVLAPLVGLRRYNACRCYRDRPVGPFDNGLLQSPYGKRPLTTQDILHKVIVPCDYFIPSENYAIPNALCYEMCRYDYVATAPRKHYINDSDLLFNDWAFVDCHFLLYFLLYLNHVKLNMVSHAATDVSCMDRLLKKKQDTSHKETCWNLLGWVYKEQCYPDKAMECYKKPLEVKPHCNAARLHIKELESIGTSQK